MGSMGDIGVIEVNGEMASMGDIGAVAPILTHSPPPTIPNPNSALFNTKTPNVKRVILIKLKVD